MVKRTVAGREFQIRPLKRKEVNRLRKAGIHLLRPENDTLDEAVDQVLQAVLSVEDLAAADELPQKDAVWLYNEIVVITYGGEDAEKNSSGYGNGTQTLPAPTTAETAGK